MRPTNLLIVMSDEHSRRILSCYSNAAVRTPTLDALAARGTRFASAYCQTPICVPSRASVATGRYAHALGAGTTAPRTSGPRRRAGATGSSRRGNRVTTGG